MNAPDAKKNLRRLGHPEVFIVLTGFVLFADFLQHVPLHNVILDARVSPARTTTRRGTGCGHHEECLTKTGVHGHSESGWRARTLALP
jgi:hypothetical protein